MKINIRNLDKPSFMDGINQLKAFSYYLKIPEDTIKTCILNNECICSPLRIDNNPSFSFYLSGNKIKARDFAGFFWGDIIDLVAMLKGIKVDKLTLKYIVDEIKATINSSDDNIITDIKPIQKEIKDILYMTRKWEKLDELYWKQYGLPLDFLIQENVYPVKIAMFHNQPIYEYNPKDPCYAYYLGHVKNKAIIKLYFPFRKKGNYKKPRFITNSDILQGIPTLKKEKLLIISKANKDRMIIKYKAMKYNLSITSIALSSENRVLTKTEYKTLQNYEYKQIISLLDIDKTGINGMRYLRNQYNIPSTHLLKSFLLRGFYYSSKIKFKDYSDFLALYNIQLANKVELEFIEYLRKSYDIDIEQSLNLNMPF